MYYAAARRRRLALKAVNNWSVGLRPSVGRRPAGLGRQGRRSAGLWRLPYGVHERRYWLIREQLTSWTAKVVHERLKRSILILDLPGRSVVARLDLGR